ncbi:hypothetical protein BIW11_12127 [Tropilaelaps mercedesae]|uniref:Uncharacterized protein n=1 Tax=Tropilaelaps mercedesae TaxID=418985 RepID=A0A1V9X7X2_9ACAR|nr:hypothetical protein BIW11_12127 [Tropilaelaps mercedesae]
MPVTCAPACSCFSQYYWMAPIVPLLVSGLIKACAGLTDDRIAFEGFCETGHFQPKGGMGEKFAMFLLNLIFYFLHPFLMLGVVSRVQACEKIQEIKEHLSPRRMYTAVKERVYATEKASPTRTPPDVLKDTTKIQTTKREK